MIRAGITPYRVLGQRTVGDLRITHFTQAARSRIPRHYHENATLCVLLRGAARDQFRYRVIEYEPGAVIYRPPGEGHSHEFGEDNMAAIVIEIPAARLHADSALHFLSELRFESAAPTLGDCAQILSGTATVDRQESVKCSQQSQECHPHLRYDFQLKVAACVVCAAIEDRPPDRCPSQRSPNPACNFTAACWNRSNPRRASSVSTLLSPALAGH
jgi:quercetin dioxygenase-like cupin family protein